ncbi:MAG: exosortase A [Acidobacteriaceae bacterium]
MSATQGVVTEPTVSPVQNFLRILGSWKVLLLFVLAIAVYYDVLWRLVQSWSTDPNFSHGFIVPLFSAFVVWTQRDRLAEVPLKPSNWGLPIIGFSIALVIVGNLGAELFISRVSLLFFLAGLIVFLSGWRMFRVLLFPWVFLFLMVPVPAIIFSQLTLPLQTLAAKLAAAALQFVGIPILREGNVLALPALSLEVAEACSGIRSLLSLGTLAIIYGYFLEENTVRRTLIALAAIPIAVLANGFRIFGTGLLVQYWDADKALGFFHEFSGWLVFVVSMFLLFLTHKLLALVFRPATVKEAK